MGLKELLTDLSDLGDKAASDGFKPVSEYQKSSGQVASINPHVIHFQQRNAKKLPPDEGQLIVMPFGKISSDNEGEFGDLEAQTNDLLRGGSGFNLYRRGQDWNRISRFFDTAKGDNFQRTQIGLQLMNPRVDAPVKGMLDNLAGELSFGLFGLPDPNQQVYNNGLNTKMSALLSGVSAIPREGLIPMVHHGYDNVTKRSLWQKPGGGDDEAALTHLKGNRQVFLYEHKIRGKESSGFGLGGWLEEIGLGPTMDVINNLFGYGEELYSYLAGPGSTLGIGRTYHGRYSNSGLDNYANDLTTPFQVSSSYGKLSNSQMLSPHGPPNFIGARKIVDSITNKNTEPRPFFDYSKKINSQGEVRTYHIGSRIGIGSPGKRLSVEEKKKYFIEKPDGSPGTTINYNVFIADKVDKINALDVVKDEGTSNWLDIAYRDLIRFRFEAIDNNTSKGQSINADVMVFRAFLEDISDDYSAEHNNFKYNGRGENFYTYNGFKRDISVSFKIAAQSRHEMMPLYRKLNFLVSNTAPDYSPEGRMRTPYVRMTVGHWMNRIPGVISSVGLKWVTDYPWEINMDGPESTNPHMLVLPHVLDVSLSFLPIHNFLPQKGVKTPFILPNPDAASGDGTIKPAQKWLAFEAQKLADAKKAIKIASDKHEKLPKS